LWWYELRPLAKTGSALTVARCAFAGLHLDGTQASVLGSTDVRLDVVPDHHHFVCVETESIECQVEERACRFADDVCPDIGGVFERGDERTKVERDPALAPAVAITM
jgi:hypothetical protein